MSKNPKFAVITVYVNGEGEVVHVVDSSGNKLKKSHYGPQETKLLTDAILVTPNYCRWRLQNGRWVCT